MRPAAVLAVVTMLLGQWASGGAAVVTNTLDSGPGSLRRVVAEAADGEVVTFDLDPGEAKVIALRAPLINALQSRLTIDAGSIPGGVTIDGQGETGIFEVSENVELVLVHCTLTRGSDSAIINHGTLLLEKCTVSHSSAPSRGGGIRNHGTLTLEGCTLSENTAPEGAALYNGDGGSALLRNCTLALNVAEDSGGGVFNAEEAALIHCTISANSAQHGGGVSNPEEAMLTLENSIVAGNSPTNVAGTGVRRVTGSVWVEGDPLLAPLDYYGGPTKTMPPLYNSPVIDIGWPSVPFPLTDQRGLPRIAPGGFDGRESIGIELPDIGAVELGPASVVTHDPATLGRILSAPPGGRVFILDDAPTTHVLSEFPLVIRKVLFIDASLRRRPFSLSGRGATHLFEVDAGAELFLRDLSITGGVGTTTGGILVRFPSSTLSLRDCWVSGNNGGVGAGIYVIGGKLTLTNSTVSSNGANIPGAGIYNAGGTIHVEQSSILRNSGPGIVNVGGTILCDRSTISSNEGGGIINRGIIRLDRSKLLKNSGSSGAGIRNWGALTLHDSEVRGNVAEKVGGGILNATGGVITLLDSIISGNVAGSGGGLFNEGRGTVTASEILGNYSETHGGGVLQARGTLALDHCSILGNRASRDAGGAFLAGGELEMSRSTLSQNVAGGDGGGILQSSGTLDLELCSIMSNKAGGDGGGVVLVDGALELSSSTLSQNVAEGEGGGIFSSGTLMMNGCCLFGNSSGAKGGAICNEGSATITNATIAENRASDPGGGLNNAAGELALIHCTVMDNESDASGAGIVNEGRLTLENSVVAKNVDGREGSDLSRSAGDEVVFAGKNFIGGDPLLGPLGFYGGPTQTMAPRRSSAVIDGGVVTVNTPETDQRGRARVLEGDAPPDGLAAPDLGAVEIEAAIVVTNSHDSGEGSLRDTIASAELGKTLVFDPSLDGTTISLAGLPLSIDKALSIDASFLAHGLTIDAGGRSRVFNILEGALSELRGLTITGGNEIYGGGVAQSGGVLSLTDCKLHGNEAVVGGAVSVEEGTLTLERCSISDNTAAEIGGAIDNLGGTLTLVDSSVRENVSHADGGGIQSIDGELTIERSLIADNKADRSGGGVYHEGGSLTLQNATIVGNRARIWGGGIYHEGGELVVRNCTASGNLASTSGGGIFNRFGTVTVENSIVAANTAHQGDNEITSNRFVHEVGANLIGGQPLLASLGWYGGPTRSMPLLADSPAIDGGVGTAHTPATDQRGHPRRVGSTLDLGAYETGNASGYTTWTLESIRAGLDNSFSGDADRNGISNGLEYAAGRDGMPEVSWAEGVARVSFGYREQAEDDVVWRVLRSTDLKNFSVILRIDEGVATSPPGIFLIGQPPRYHLLDADPPKRGAYYRLEVERK